MTLQRAVIDYRTEFWEYGQLSVALSRVKSPAVLCILLPDDMDDFTIRPPVDPDVVQIVESINASGGPLAALRLPTDNLQPNRYSFDESDTTQSDEIPCPNDDLDAPEDETESLPGVEHQAPEIVHPHPVDIPCNVHIIASILQDPQVLRLNFLGDALPDFIPFTDPVPMATVLHRALETCYGKFFLTSGLKSHFVQGGCSCTHWSKPGSYSLDSSFSVMHIDISQFPNQYPKIQ
jgi:hypothetical protein